MLTYAGRGYTPRFTSGMDDLIARLGQGEEITVIAGPDDICLPWLTDPEKPVGPDALQPHCHEPRITGRDRHAAADIGRLLDLPIETGTSLRLDGDLLARLRRAFQDGSIRTGCAGCQWQSVCDDLSRHDFQGCRLSA
ncbi:MAG: DUF1284 domain-containing protein [Dongiaceae bacterium]